MRYPAHPFVLLISLLLFAPQSSAQSQEPAASAPVPVIRLFTQLVSLDVLVQNKKTGDTIGPLSVEDLQVYEDGVLQPVSYFSQDQLPLSVVFLFDLTDTVRPTLNPLAAAALEILGHLKPQDEAAILVFSSHTELLQDFTTDRALAAAAVEKASGMKSSDGTFIHEDMYEAVEQVKKSTIPGSRRALVWLTDGTSNLENAATRKAIGKQAPPELHSKEQAVENLLHSGAVVSALIDRTAKTDAFIAAQDINPLSFFFWVRVDDIRKYAELTDGPVLNTSKTEAAVRLALLIDQLRSRYTIGYYRSSKKPEETFCKLQLALRPDYYKRHPELRKSNVVLRTKSGYYR